MSNNFSIPDSDKVVKDYDYFEALRRPFLSLSINPRQNSTIANRFLEQVRSGVTDPHEVVQRVAGRGRNHAVYGMITQNRAAAVHMARWAIEWNALPKRERDRIKFEQSRPYVEAYREGFYAWNQLLNEQGEQVSR